MNGTNFNPLLLFPSVSVPVSNTTPMLSPLVVWDHSNNWPVPTAEEFIALGDTCAGSGSAGSFEIDVSSADSEDAYLSDHIVDGRMIFPGTGYLVLAWRQFAKLLRQSFGQFPLVFENIDIHRATILPSSGECKVWFYFCLTNQWLMINIKFDLTSWFIFQVDRCLNDAMKYYYGNMMFIAGSVKLDVTLSPGSQKFEVTEAGTLVASGYIRAANDEEMTFEANDIRSTCNSGNCNSDAMNLNSDEFYKELRLHGVKYGPAFRGIVSATENGMLLCLLHVFESDLTTWNRSFRRHGV